MFWPSLRKVGQGVLQLLIGNGFGTFDPPVTLTFDGCVFEEGRSRRSQVIGQKRKDYRQTETNRPTCAEQYARSSSKGGIKTSSW